MAIVFLPLNDIGLGHLSRAFTLATAMQSAGGAPVILAQGHYPEFMARCVPGTSIGTVYKQNHHGRLQLAATVTNYARLTTPAIVIEDTHPAPFSLGDHVHRFLVVRPTPIDFLRELESEHTHT